LGPEAAGTRRTDHAPGRDAPAAGVAGVGQPGRTQDAGVRVVVIRPRGDAAVHTGRGFVAEYGREHPARPQASGVGRPAPDPPGRDHRLVRGGYGSLESGPDALRVGRGPGDPAEAVAGSTTPRRRVRCDNPPIRY